VRESPAKKCADRHGLFVGADALERMGVPRGPQGNFIALTQQCRERITQLFGLGGSGRDRNDEGRLDGVGRDGEWCREATWNK
jgi:hypothetical protein